MVESDKIRVLIVDDVAETRENIRKLLQFEKDIEVVATSRTGKDAIQLTQEVSPHVVLMDINLPDIDGISVTETIRQKVPAAQVVILSVQGDQNYMRKAMLAGARDFLTKPPLPDELVGAIRRAGKLGIEEQYKKKQVLVTGIASQEQAKVVKQQNGKIILVYSPKGGAGCTTVAVNLATALHNEETPVVIADANLQYGDVAIFFNEQGKNTILDLSTRVDDLDLEIVENVLIKNSATGVHILASPAKPEDAEEVKPNQLAKLLQFLCQIYAYVVVDSSSHLSDTTISVLDIADAIVLVTTQEIPCIKNIRLFLDLLTTMNIPNDRITFIMNKYDRRIAITPEKISDNLKQKVYAVIPLDERTVIPAVNRGIPFMAENRSQPASRGIYTLVEALRAKLLKTDSQG
jgi:pilus assembly protein CpaE